MKKHLKSNHKVLKQLTKLKRNTQDLPALKSIPKQDLQEDNSIWQAIVQACPLAIIAVDAKYAVTIWNPSAEDLFGWQTGEVLNRLPFLREDKTDEFRLLFERAMKGKSLNDIEMFRRKKDGTAVYVSVSAAPLKDNKGEISGIMAVISDVTKRRAIEDALKMSKEYYRLIVENSPDNICNIPLGGRNVEINTSGVTNTELNIRKKHV